MFTTLQRKIIYFACSLRLLIIVKSVKVCALSACAICVSVDDINHAFIYFINQHANRKCDGGMLQMQYLLDCGAGCKNNNKMPELGDSEPETLTCGPSVVCKYLENDFYGRS